VVGLEELVGGEGPVVPSEAAEPDRHASHLIWEPAVMAPTRVHFEDLPDTVHTAIEAQAGPVLKVEPISDGLNSQLSARVHTAHGVFFVKGLRTDHPWVWTQERERLINPFIHHLSAELRWAIETGGWNLLGFEDLGGRSVDYSPGSPDLPMVVWTLRQLQEIPAPDLTLKRAEQRWAAYTSTPAMFVGDALLHTDWSPGNVLINYKANLVDWAWPTRGAAWIDPACWVVWLIASGHTPQQAEAWAAHMPSWDQAPVKAVDAFARAQAAMWNGIAADDPQFDRVTAAAKQWAEYRNHGPRRAR